MQELRIYVYGYYLEYSEGSWRREESYCPLDFSLKKN